MAHHFAESGYLTGLIGKMHFNDAHNHGFEYYLSINDWLMFLGPKVQHYANEIANHAIGPQFFDTVDDDGSGFPDLKGMWDGPSPWVGNVDRWEVADIASPLEPEDHLDMFVARATAKFLKRYRDQRFFLVASFMKPHPPFHPPRPWSDQYPVHEMELPDVGDIAQYPPHVQNRIRNMQRLGETRLKAHRAGYLGNLAFVDHCIGHVCDALEQLGLTRDTLVVYTSDHGEMDGDHGIMQKFCLFEPSVRVPLIVSQPGQIPEGRTTDALTEQIGLYPTLAELTGLPAPAATTRIAWPGAPQQLDGTSFAELVHDPDLPGPDAVFSEYNLRARPCQYMVRTRRYKYILNEGSTDELYDHETDPGECVNRVSDAALDAVRSELCDRLTSWYDPAQNPHRPEGP